ncbi:MAG TPA: PQQ-binding-like beta-propeller repeat protein, partial [Candidatus Paceibacterota bacterium]|nr:PQQ-binding-like beta-propeller repeat protein [Candidatus Paceibacterota bacterium]
EALKMDIPQFAGQKSVSEAREWRKIGAVVAAISALALLIIGAWGWYVWVGSRPKPVFAVSFPDGLRSGQSEFCGKDQLVFRHWLTLSRYDLKSKKEVWSRELVGKQQIDDAVAAETKFMEALITQAKIRGTKIPAMDSPEEMRQDAERAAASELEMYVRGSNVWVMVESGKLVRYDWETGNPGKEISIAPGFHETAREGDELMLLTKNNLGQRVIHHVNLVSAETRVETLGEPLKAVATGNAAALRPTANQTGGYKPLDMDRLAADAQRLSMPGKIALPALVGNAINQDRLMREMNADEIKELSKMAGFEGAGDDSPLVSSKHGNYEFTVRLLEERMVTQKAMKDPPKKSALDGNLNVTQTAEVANELLNEMRRNAGADTVTENQSRYLVTVRSADKKVPDWSGEVVGQPSLIPCRTVTVVAAGSTVVVLDKSNKKLWQGSLTHVAKKNTRLFDDETRFGEGPCVEHDGRLYICDAAMLTAFDLNSGNVFWRIPSVGIAGLRFDDKGMLYVNSTTADPESIKFSKQIDVRRKIAEVILKVDPGSGKILWSTQAGGFISYLSGKFVYVWSGNDADDDKDSPLRLGLETPSYVRIKRIDPGNGKVLWDHYQPRAPLDVKFAGNNIQIVFKNELQVLSYLTF